MAPLGLLNTGDRAEIIEFGVHKDFHVKENHMNHIEDMGLRVGKTVEVLNNGGIGPMLLKVDGSRIAIGRKMAMKIMVKKTVDSE